MTSSERFVPCSILFSHGKHCKHPFSWIEICSSTKIASIDCDSVEQISAVSVVLYSS